MNIPIPRRRVARAEAIWAFVGIVVIWAGFVVLAEVKFPWWSTANMRFAMNFWIERVAEHPERPLLAVIGSSRIGTAFCPSELPSIYDAEGWQVLVFNYSHHGSGPRLNLMQMHRLMRAGHEPKWLVIEYRTGPSALRSHFKHAGRGRRIPVLMPYENKPKLLMEFSRLRLNIVYRNRTSFLRTFAPPSRPRPAKATTSSLAPSATTRS